MDCSAQFGNQHSVSYSAALIYKLHQIASYTVVDADYNCRINFKEFFNSVHMLRHSTLSSHPIKRLVQMLPEGAAEDDEGGR
jgi:hypothetical protein